MKAGTGLSPAGPWAGALPGDTGTQICGAGVGRPEPRVGWQAWP